MNGKVFGQLALQLLEQASIPGNALEAALQFKTIAAALAEGKSVVVASEESE